MNVQELFNLGNQLFNEGRQEAAMDIWNRVNSLKDDFGPVYLMQHNVFRSQGNLQRAFECLAHWNNCPITPASLHMVPAIQAQMEELRKQINPQLQPPQPVPVK